MSDAGPDLEKLRSYLLSPQKKPERKAALIKAHLLHQPEPWARDLLLQVLSANQDEKVLRQAVRALGYRKDPTLVDQLAPLTARAESHMLAHLLKAVLRLDRPRGIALIKQILESRDDTARMVALVALSRVDPRAVIPLMVPLTDNPSPVTRRAAAELLSGVSPPSGVELALPWFRKEKEGTVLESLARYLRREIQATHRPRLQELVEVLRTEEPAGSPKLLLLERLAGASGEVAISRERPSIPDAAGGKKAKPPRMITTVIPQEKLFDPEVPSKEFEALPKALPVATEPPPVSRVRPLATPAPSDEPPKRVLNAAGVESGSIDLPAPIPAALPSGRTQDTRPFSVTEPKGMEARAKKGAAPPRAEPPPAPSGPLLRASEEPWTDRLFAFFLGGVSVACLLVLGLLWLTEPVPPAQKPRPEAAPGDGFEAHPTLGARGSKLSVEGSLINLNQAQGYVVLQLEKPIVVSVYFPAGLPKIPLELGAAYKAAGILRHIESEQIVVLEAEALEKKP